MPRSRKSYIVLAVVALAATVTLAVTIPNTITINATNSQGTGSISVDLPASIPFDQNGLFTWNMNPGDQQIKNGSTLLATINSLNFQLDNDPAVVLNFAVIAGSVDTTFTISSPTMSFGTMVNPSAFATAGITLTDNNSDGSAVTGLEPTIKAYRAFYNGSTDWAYLISSFTGGADGTVLSSDRQPVSGRQTIAASVSSINSEFSFVLSAFDSASGTSRFDLIVPEPASFGLLVFSALLFPRRRMHNATK